eukprot:4143507-Pyramimonas_sp.AAC.1
MAVQMQEKVFRAANDIMRILKRDLPHAVPDCILLLMPRNKTPWGKCSLIPNGPPVLSHYSLDGIRGLMAPVEKGVAHANF